MTLNIYIILISYPGVDIKFTSKTEASEDNIKWLWAYGLFSRQLCAKRSNLKKHAGQDSYNTYKKLLFRKYILSATLLLNVNNFMTQKSLSGSVGQIYHLCTKRGFPLFMVAHSSVNRVVCLFQNVSRMLTSYINVASLFAIWSI